jgi:hypothetical protein
MADSPAQKKGNKIFSPVPLVVPDTSPPSGTRVDDLSGSPGGTKTRISLVPPVVLPSISWEEASKTSKGIPEGRDSKTPNSTISNGGRSMSNIVTGRQLRAAHILAGLTQRQLAQAVGDHERTARYWELMERKAPTLMLCVLEEIEAVFRVPTG